MTAITLPYSSWWACTRSRSVFKATIPRKSTGDSYDSTADARFLSVARCCSSSSSSCTNRSFSSCPPPPPRQRQALPANPQASTGGRRTLRSVFVPFRYLRLLGLLCSASSEATLLPCSLAFKNPKTHVHPSARHRHRHRHHHERVASSSTHLARSLKRRDCWCAHAGRLAAAACHSRSNSNSNSFRRSARAPRSPHSAASTALQTPSAEKARATRSAGASPCTRQRQAQSQTEARERRRSLPPWPGRGRSTCCVFQRSLSNRLGVFFKADQMNVMSLSRVTIRRD